MENSPNIDKFLAGLEKLSAETGVYLAGNTKYVDFAEGRHELLAEHAYSAPEVIEVNVGTHVCRDRSGRNLVTAVSIKPLPPAVAIKNKSFEIVKDIEPYKSMIDGSMITSRLQHRTHLKDNNCFELGNEKKATDTGIRDAAKPDRVTHEQVARAYDEASRNSNRNTRH